MDFFEMLSFVGGVALFLYGMQVMGEAIRRQAGGRFKVVLQKLTSNKWWALLLGTGVTALIQSSSASCVMVLGFINSGLMDLGSSIGLIMGANIGTCATAWILSLNSISGTGTFFRFFTPDTFVPILALVGAAIQMISHDDKTKDIGLVMLGFSVLMYGMDHMSEALKPITSSDGFRNIITIFSNPFLGVAAGFVLAAVTQSSSSSVGILQAISAAADIRFATAFPIILGINIGAMVIVLLSSVGGNRDARRAALIAILYNAVGAVVFLPLWLLAERFGLGLANIRMGYVSIAVTHTVYKTLLAFVMLPFDRQIVSISRFLIHSNETENRFQLLDERFLHTPSVAVAWCEELANDMALLTRTAVDQALEVVENFEEKKIVAIHDAEEQCDIYEDKLGSYMVKLSQKQMTDSDSRTAGKILHCLNDLERISDHAVSLAKASKELHEKDLVFSSIGYDDLLHVVNPVREIVSITMNAFLRNDVELAADVEPLEQVVDMLIGQVKARHVARLQTGECTIMRGFIFSDMLTDLSRISDHCSNIAACIIEMRTDSLDTHEYLNKIKSGDQNYSVLFDKYATKYGF